ncbi:MAG: TIM44-like domain-containing protein [Polyangiaceae bacterium]|nr:TIM44-like domain-containing protein [Polyangiaceae bacterium]
MRAGGRHARRMALAGGVLLGLLLLFWAAEGAARPGGGHSYSGGGSSSSGGGGGGSGGGGEGAFQAIFYLLMLCIEAPAIGIPVVCVLVAIGVGVVVAKKRERGSSWSTSAPAAAPVAARGSRPRAFLQGLRRDDPDFSLVLFEDFLYALYARAHEARGNGRLAELAPYLGPGAGRVLGAARAPGVKDVIIGAMALERACDAARGPERWVTATVRFEACMTELDAAGRPAGVFAVERWTLARRRDAKSKAPGKATVFGCPSCGGPLEALRGETCAYCGTTFRVGVFDWCVDDITVVERQRRAPALTADVAEQGTSLPTVVDPQADQRFRALAARDPHFSWATLQARLALVFARLQVAWSTREWLLARPFVSDNLFQMQLFYVQSYVAARLYNKTERARITHVQCANVESDKYFDAITVRVYATGLDYTVDESGKVVSGSKKRERPYSEYWTLIRGAQVSRPTLATPECPNCGAPLEAPPGAEVPGAAPVGIGMTGNCLHCRAKVTNGDFDWVLSRIEQDEAYQG